MNLEAIGTIVASDLRGRGLDVSEDMGQALALRYHSGLVAYLEVKEADDAELARTVVNHYLAESRATYGDPLRGVPPADGVS